MPCNPYRVSLDVGLYNEDQQKQADKKPDETPPGAESSREPDRDPRSPFLIMKRGKHRLSLNARIKRLLPFELYFKIQDVLIPGRLADNSSTGEMLRAYNEDRLTLEHIPALVLEAQNMIDTMQGTGDEPRINEDRQQLERFIENALLLEKLGISL